MSDEKKNEIITEESLRKALETLEGKKEETTQPKPEVEVGRKDGKTFDQALGAGASHELRKALEGSAALAELSGVIGLHMDESLTTLQKSLEAQALRDAAILRIMEAQNIKIEALTKALEDFGKKPGQIRPLSRLTADDVAPRPGEAKTGGEAEETGTLDKAALLKGLEHMAKSAEGTPEWQKIAVATAGFEATGRIDDKMLHRAMATAQKLRAAESAA